MSTLPQGEALQPFLRHPELGLALWRHGVSLPPLPFGACWNDFVADIRQVGKFNAIGEDGSEVLANELPVWHGTRFDTAMESLVTRSAVATCSLERSRTVANAARRTRAHTYVEFARAWRCWLIVVRALTLSCFWLVTARLPVAEWSHDDVWWQLNVYRLNFNKSM